MPYSTDTPTPYLVRRLVAAALLRFEITTEQYDAAFEYLDELEEQK